MNQATHHHESDAVVLDRLQSIVPTTKSFINPESPVDSTDCSHGSVKELNTSCETVQLHNARNVTTHLCAVLDELIDQHSKFSLRPIQQVASLLTESDQDSIQFQSIGSHLESLLDSIQSEQNQIHASLSTLESTVQDLTETITRRPSSDLGNNALQSFLIDELIEQVINKSRKRLTNQNIQISMTHHSHAVVTTERQLLNQVIHNLITNSEQSLNESDKRQKLISIECGTCEGWTTVSVRDNGCGIKKSSRTQILDLGFTTKDAGQGIGLSFCKETMERLHGYIEINSEGINCGTTVTLHLPSQ